jgi:hypothetical protein
MNTQIVRRLYIYAAAFLGLQLLAVGARGMLRLLLEAALSAPAIDSGEQRTAQLSLYTALLIVGVPLWAGHWWWAQRTLGRPDEQHSALRRLYGYAVLLVAILGMLFAARSLIGALLAGTAFAASAPELAGALATLAVNGALWGYHWRVFGADRAVVERAGAPATLRRWYLVITLAFGLGMAGYGAVELLHQLLDLVVAPAIGTYAGLPLALAGTLAGLAIWLPHQRWAGALIRQATPVRADEARSTLRQVYGALVITIALIAALSGLTTLLYWVLQAGFGVTPWSAFATEHTEAFALVVVAAAVWWYHRAQLAEEARRSDIAARSDTARRVTGYLTAAVGLGALYVGAGGLLSTLLQLLVAPDVIGSGWRDGVSLGVALTVVALPVYAWTARSMERLAGSSPVEERTLARRVYLYAALLFGIVATIVAVVAVLRLVIGAVLGTPEENVGAELARWLGYSVVGLAIGAAYALLLRGGSGGRETLGADQTIAILADEPLRAALATALRRELPGAQVRGLAADQAAGAADELADADTLIVALAAALDEASLRRIGAFTGRRILLPTATPGYDVVGARSDDDIVRAAVRAVRTAASSAPPEAPPAIASQSPG